MVSVIIPTFNRRDFLLQAVESVLKQTFRDLELIVADDGSTDDSRQALESTFRDERLRYLCLPHRGVSAARNRGLRTAKYEWIAFLDSDDLWTPRKLQLQLEALDQDPRYLVAYTNEIWIRRGRRVNPRKIHRKFGGWIFHRCLPLCILSPSSVLLHRKVLKTTGAFSEDLPVCEDYDLWLRLTCRLPVLFIDEPLIVKRGGHQDQLSKSLWGLDRFRVASLIRLLQSGGLTYFQQQLTAREIVGKAEILAKGYSNRGKLAESESYFAIARRFRALGHSLDHNAPSATSVPGCVQEILNEFSDYLGKEISTHLNPRSPCRD